METTWPRTFYMVPTWPRPQSVLFFFSLWSDAARTCTVHILCRILLRWIWIRSVGGSTTGGWKPMCSESNLSHLRFITMRWNGLQWARVNVPMFRTDLPPGSVYREHRMQHPKVQ